MRVAGNRLKYDQNTKDCTGLQLHDCPPDISDPPGFRNPMIPAVGVSVSPVFKQLGVYLKKKDQAEDACEVVFWRTWKRIIITNDTGSATTRGSMTDHGRPRIVCIPSNAWEIPRIFASAA